MSATARPDPIPLLADGGDTLGVVGMGVMGCTSSKACWRPAPRGAGGGTSRSADTCREVAADLGVSVEPDVQHRLARPASWWRQAGAGAVALAALAAAGRAPTRWSSRRRRRRLDAALDHAGTTTRSSGHAQHAVIGEGDGDLAAPGPPRTTRARRILGTSAAPSDRGEALQRHHALSGSGPAYHYLIMSCGRAASASACATSR
jgi:hypothetical protein